MNERIIELAEQSGLKYYFDPMLWLKYEKFAELIVKECVKVLDSMTDPEDSERYFWAIQNAVTKILEHFGVEE